MNPLIAVTADAIEDELQRARGGGGKPTPEP